MRGQNQGNNWETRLWEESIKAINQRQGLKDWRDWQGNEENSALKQKRQVRNKTTRKVMLERFDKESATERVLLAKDKRGYERDEKRKRLPSKGI